MYVDDQERWNGSERCDDEGVENEGDDDGAVQDTTDGNMAFIHMLHTIEVMKMYL